MDASEGKYQQATEVYAELLDSVENVPKDFEFTQAKRSRVDGPAFRKRRVERAAVNMTEETMGRTAARQHAWVANSTP